MLVFLRVLVPYLLSVSVLCGLLVISAITYGNVKHSDVLAYTTLVGTDDDIFLADVATRLTHNLTQTPFSEVSPVWSPDGSQIAYIAQREAWAASVQTIVVSTGEVTNLGEPATFHDAGSSPYYRPIWSENGQDVLFSRNGQAPGSSLIIFSDNPTDDQPAEILSLDHPDAQHYLRQLRPNFYASPNGKLEVFADYRNNAWGIFVQEATDPDQPAQLTGDSAEPRLLVPLIGDEVFLESSPTWSPDSQRIAFVLISGSAAEVFIVSVEGDTSPQRITYGGGANPVWRP